MGKRKSDDADARADLKTPKPSKSSTRVPDTPLKKPRKQSPRDNDLSTVARSLTPLFNGFKAARDRASLLGGRYGVKKVRKSNPGFNSGSRGGTTSKDKQESKNVKSNNDKTMEKRDDRRGGTQMSVHTGDVKREVRVLRFDSLVGETRAAVPKRKPENMR